MDPEFERSIEEIAETLRSGKKNKNGCALFIGAGCSVSANIDTAWQIVEKIKSQYPKAYGRAKKRWKIDTPDYPQAMGELNPIERNQIIKDEVKKAKVNWAHIAIGLLIQQGYVDRVLTTNFDPLVSRSCALLGEFPAIFDIAGSSKSKIKTERISDKAIFHLHGQYNGFVMVHTDDDFKICFPAIKQVLNEAQKNRTWIVVGYSGRNDPIFKHLTKAKEFDCGLHWVGYGDKDPKEHVSKQLLKKVKSTYFTRGYDADSFFIKLTQELEIFPPKFASKPFTHLQDTFEDIMPYTISDQPEDILDTTRAKIKAAIEKFEKGEEKLFADALSLLMAGKYDETVEFCKLHNLETYPKLKETLAWVYLMQGLALYEQGKTKTGKKADELFAQAEGKYQQALKIKPDKYEVFNNWGLALLEQAKTKTGKEADELFAQAQGKYQQALKIKPDKSEALFYWGNTNYWQAMTKTDKEADELFAQAREKYQQALKIKPDMHDVLNHWGVTLHNQAKTKTGKEADKLFVQAGEKYQQALKIKPDFPLALFNMACLAALTGDDKACRNWLGKRIEREPLAKWESMADSDFDSVRELGWFKKLVAKSKKKRG